jgi:hypothetical protein
MNLATVRKAIVATLGVVCLLVATVPDDLLPDQWRPWVGIILGLGTVAGVYRVRNDPPAAKAVEPTRIAEPGERPAHGPREKWRK